MPNRRRAPAVIRKKVVNYSWASIFIGLTTVPAATKTLLAFFFLGTGFEETVTRVRGLLSVQSDQATGSEEQRGAFGLIRVTDRARVAGAASIPGPATDGDDDGWQTWMPIAQTSVLDVGTGIQGALYPIDSKAQRIVRQGQEIAVMVENIGATTGMQVQLALRVLSRFRS